MTDQIPFEQTHTDWDIPESRSRTKEGKLKGDKIFANDRKDILTISSSPNGHRLSCEEVNFL